MGKPTNNNEREEETRVHLLKQLMGLLHPEIKQLYTPGEHDVNKESFFTGNAFQQFILHNNNLFSESELSDTEKITVVVTLNSQLYRHKLSDDFDGNDPNRHKLSDDNDDDNDGNDLKEMSE